VPGHLAEAIEVFAYAGDRRAVAFCEDALRGTANAVLTPE
jgi:hypothetical protein